MKKLILITTTLLFACFSAGAADKSKTTADHLQDVSVTIRAEGDFCGEGSGVIFSRKDADGNTVNFVWTVAHVIDNLRKTRKTVVNGTPKTIVEFKDPMVVRRLGKVAALWVDCRWMRKFSSTVMQMMVMIWHFESKKVKFCY